MRIWSMTARCCRCEYQDSTVEGLEEMARYVSCTYGEAAYAEFNAVACNHGLRDCALAAPMKCESCGNGVREGSETCDGSDWLYPRCDAMRPGLGETSLRFWANPDVDTIHLRLIEPCRELEFEVDGRPLSFTKVRPGASCWVNRCTTPGIAQLDYCEGEEPPPCP
jgi:hypothetical protein